MSGFVHQWRPRQFEVLVQIFEENFFFFIPQLKISKTTIKFHIKTQKNMKAI